MKNRSPKHDIPESVCLFNKQEIEYINQCAKSIPYRTDIQTATINVPPDHFDIASEHLHVRHLINKFAFVVQATIGAEYLPGKDFNPELRQRHEPTPDNSIAMPKRGEVWRYKPDNERWYIKSASDKQFGITILDSMKSDKTKGIEEIEQLVMNGDLCKENT